MTTLVIAWASICAGGVAVLTEVKLSDSRAAVARGDLASGAEDAVSASALQPWAAAPDAQLALVEERRNDLPAAREAIALATSDAPEDWRLWLVTTRLAVKAGDVADATRALRRARTLNPRSPLLNPTDDG